MASLQTQLDAATRRNEKIMAEWDSVKKENDILRMEKYAAELSLSKLKEELDRVIAEYENLHDEYA